MAFEIDPSKVREQGVELGFRLSEVMGESGPRELAEAIKFIGLNQRQRLFMAIESLKREIPDILEEP
ncbi:MAG: hypothetical protein AAB660_01340 [Patescibacteria group bacterium]